jgi:hypothetical protein
MVKGKLLNHFFNRHRKMQKLTQNKHPPDASQHRVAFEGRRQIETRWRISGLFLFVLKINPEHSLHRFSKPGILNTFVTVERNLTTGYLEWPHRCATS